MSERTNFIEDIKTNTDKVIEITVSYNAGGWNYFAGVKEARGYYLHVSPVLKESKHGYSTKTYTGFSGIKSCIEETKRFSQKKLDEISSKVKELDVYQECISHVCSKNGLKLCVTV